MLKVKIWNWRIWRPAVAIVLIPATFLFVVASVETVFHQIYSLIFDPKNVQDIGIPEYIFLAFGNLIYLGLSYLAFSPKEYNCMGPVRKFMKYRTLKRCIHKEDFWEPVHFYDHSEKKEGYMHLYVSKYWVCLSYDSFGKISHSPYCIPRNMIELIYIREGRVRAKGFWKDYRGIVVTIVTKIGNRYSVGYVKKSEINHVVKTLSEVMQMEIYNADDEKTIRLLRSAIQKQKAFSAKIHNEQEFLDYIYQI